MKKTINIVIPMAGLGSRFSASGFKEIKPLINVKGKLMFEWAVSSFDFLKNDFNANFIFVVLKEHIEKYDIDRYIHDLYPDATTVILDNLSKGQAQSVYSAKELINNDEMLIIYNSDTYSQYDLISFPLNKHGIDGIIPCFISDSPNYSYVKINDAGYITQVVEKQVISSFATNGLYYFSRGKDFIYYFEKMLTDNINLKGELYVGPIYNYLIYDGKKIIMAPIKENWILGTPKELEYFLKNHKKSK